MRQTVFLLSPAHCGGRRAALLMRPAAAFPLAARLREPAGAALGEVFSFLSGLYFRGKLAYADRFAVERGGMGVRVITPGRGLESPAKRLVHEDLLAMAAVPVEPDDPRYREPLERDARRLAATLAPSDRVVLLGSVATGKYVTILESALDGRLAFPAAFVGRGDMSRGGLMLRSVRDGRELDYVPLAGAVRRGPRPPRLEPWSRERRAMGPAGVRR